MLAPANVTTAGWVFWSALVILLRELVISGCGSIGKRSFAAPVTVMAKWKTTAQIWLSGSDWRAAFPVVPFAAEIGLALLWIAAVLTVQTGYGYIREALRMSPDTAITSITLAKTPFAGAGRHGL